MKQNLAAFVILLALAGAARGFGLGLGNQFGKLGASSGAGSLTPLPTGDILLVDGVSVILQTDGASFICRAGGC
jgi:hypothetical protein